MKKTLALLFIVLSSAFTAYSQDCVDESLINPDVLCIMLWAPVCGCDGVTYSNDCVAINYGGVTSWTQGECPPQSCEDLGGVDFGECEMAMGFALINGSCQMVSGCGFVVGNVDYSPFFYQSEAACETICSELLIECEDLTNVDFGMCDMALGVGLINGQCTYISGCGWEVNGVDYSPYFYESLGDCQNACGPMPTCLDLAGIDFGICAMPLGYAMIDGSCVALSGCGWEVNGINYSPNFFQSYEDCANNCPLCINETFIDPNQFVSPIYNPVCGCNEVTYFNADVAMYEYGITSFTPGECGNSIGVIAEKPVLEVMPNPTAGPTTVKTGGNEIRPYTIYAIDGHIVKTGKTEGATTNVDLSDLSPGVYFIEIDGKRTRIIR